MMNSRVDAQQKFPALSSGRTLLDAPTALATLAGASVLMCLWLLVDEPSAGPPATWMYVSSASCAATLLALSVFVATRPVAPWVVGAREAFAGVYWLTAALAPLLSARAPSHSRLDAASEDGSLVVVGVVWITAAVAFTCAYGGPTRPDPPARSTPEDPLTRRRVSEIGIAMILVGSVAMWARFPSLAAAQAYFQADYTEVSRTASGALGYVGSILRPLLPAGVLFLWLQRRGIVLGLVLTAATVLALGSFSFNRAAVLVPLVGFVIARHAQGRRVSNRVVVVSVAAAVVAFVLIGTVRTETLNTEGGRYESADQEKSLADSVVESLQVYGQSPVRTGRAVDGRSGTTVGPAELLNSLASPVPGAPDSVREGTVTRRYNQLLYGASDTSDQVIPMPLEVWWALGIGGVLGAGVLTGLVLKRLDRRLRTSANLAEAVVFAVAGLWVAQSLIVSTTVLVQTLLYLGPALVIVHFLSRRVTA
jgi:hypothetical protein